MIIQSSIIYLLTILYIILKYILNLLKYYGLNIYFLLKNNYDLNIYFLLKYNYDKY